MVREYIGARYVPRFMGEYDATQIYEALDVVDNGSGTSYISKIPTPAGTPLTDVTHWAVYGSTSGAIINLQNQIDGLRTDVDENTSKLAGFAYPEDYGAVGDGVADDSQAFMNCIAAVGEGGTIALHPNHKYLVSIEIPAVNIIGNNATLVAKASAAHDNYALRVIPTDIHREHICIENLIIDCGGTNATDGLNGIYIDNLKMSQIQNVKIINVGEYGIYVNSGFDVTFNGITLYKPQEITTLFGTGIYTVTSDMIYTDVNIVGFLRGVYSYGSNIFDNIHVWVGVAMSTAERDNSIGFEVQGGALITNVYLDSVCSGVVVNSTTSRIVVTGVHWELYDSNDYVLIKNPTTDPSRLNNVVCDNVYINLNADVSNDYKIFNLGTPKVSNVTPNFLPTAKLYGEVPHTIDTTKCHAVKDVIRVFGDFIWFDIELTIDTAVSANEQLITLDSSPLRSGKYVTGIVNGNVYHIWVNNNFLAPINMVQYDKIYISGLIPRN